MTIGGGVKFDDVFEPLYAEGKEIRTSVKVHHREYVRLTSSFQKPDHAPASAC
jgi:hypothetical protein